MARRRRTAAMQEQAPAADEGPGFFGRLREAVSLPTLESWSTTLRTVMLNALFLGAFVLLLPVLIGQFRRDQVIIEPIAVPEALAARGLTADVAASRLWDGLLDVERRARTSKESIAALPDSRRVEFSFPDSGFSIESLIFYVRRMFNAYETRIAGEFTCADADCAADGLRLRLRVVRAGVDLVDLPPMGDRDERAYFDDAASGVLSVLDPFVAIAAAADADPLRATILARRLIRSHHPDAHWAHNLIGNIRVNADDLPGAVAEYRAALAIRSDFGIARSNLGDALRRSGDLAGAKTELHAALQSRPGDPLALAASAELALAGGDTDGAIALLLRAAEADPLEPRYLASACKVAMDAGREADARRHFAGALAIDPGYLPAFAFLAAMDLVREDYASAEKLYRDAADYAPDDAAAQAAHANLLAILKRWDDALARYRKAAALAPADAAYKLQVARCLQALARHDEALAVLAEAEALAPADGEIQRIRGDSLRESGRKEEAIAAYRKFLELDRESLMRPIVERYIELLSG